MVDVAGIEVPILTGSAFAVAALSAFIVAYALVIAEEFTLLRKSKSVVAAAGIIWVLAAYAWESAGIEGAAELLRHNLLEYAELLLFLLAAMTYVNTLEERGVFAALRSWLVTRRFSLRGIFWATGRSRSGSPPSSTTSRRRLSWALWWWRWAAQNRVSLRPPASTLSSPQTPVAPSVVFLPSLVNWLVPALCMTATIPAKRPEETGTLEHIKTGALATVGLFAGTIALTVSLHQLLHLPPFLGMMTGFGALMLYGHMLRRREVRDTLMFFYGVILCVGGLAALGFLAVLSNASYASLGPSVTNILVGIASAIIDNIPVMFAVLSIDPEMSLGQWLLVTLTAGVGGSLLSIGSAAGVALMGQARGVYTFFAHLKWSWAIALGYAASIWLHFVLNARLF